MLTRLRALAVVAASGLALVVPASGIVANGAPTAGSSPAASTPWADLAPGAQPESNPLKGFIPYKEKFTEFPHSMEWSYFPVNAVMKGPKRFDWKATDEAIRQIASRGHQTALRFYLDYPTKASGIPPYLIKDGLKTHSYDDFGNAGKSVSPDYENPELRSAVKSFIAALGKRYDGDPRIGFVQAGLLGFWGEWHTWPHNGEAGTENWFASDKVQTEVMKAYVQAFRHTQLEVRYPSAINAWLPVGYHDDSFALETKRSSLGWHFMDIVDANQVSDKWKAYSVGGELRPELQGCLFTAAGCPKIEDGGDNDFFGSLEQTHASWLLNQGAFDPGHTGADRTRAIKASQALGYALQVTSAQLPSTTRAGAVDIGLKISNTGVAPFYYDWPIRLQILDARGKVMRSHTTDWLLSAVASGSTEEFTGSMDLHGLRRGEYRVVAQGVNPMRGGMPVRFANASQDQDRDGWLTLGTMRVSGS